MLYFFYFWEPSEPSGARTRTNTEVGSTLPSAKPSLPRGLLLGEPPNVPKNANVVSRILKKVDARHKQLCNGIGRAAGPPTPLRYSIPTHLHTPKLLMNTNFHAETYLRRIREHGN